MPTITLPDGKNLNFSKDVNGDKFQNYGFLQNQCYMFKQFVNLIDIERFDSFIVLRDDVIIQPYRKIDKLVNKQKIKIPLFLKISPDESNTIIENIIEIVKNSSFSGIVATNTTIDKSSLSNI